MSPVAFPIVLAIGLIVFAAIVAATRAAPAGRAARRPGSTGSPSASGAPWSTASASGSSCRGEQPAGIMHALIFWGFVVLLLQVVTLFGRAFDADWSLPGSARASCSARRSPRRGTRSRRSWPSASSTCSTGALIAHTPRLFGLRRAEQRYRDAPHWEGVLILVFILFIVVGGLLYDHASTRGRAGGCTTSPCSCSCACCR